MRPITLGILSVLFAASPASAQTLVGQLDSSGETVGNCGHVEATVMRWTPADGPPAAFIARNFVSKGSNLWIGLGYDAQGFWSAEANASSDACDDCDDLRLVRTSHAGARTALQVTAAIPGYRELGLPEREAALKRQLFSLAVSDWPATTLRHDYTLRTPAHDPDGHIARFTGWMAEVSRQPGWRLRFGIRSDAFMCWCHDTWTGYKLRDVNSGVPVRD